MNSFSIRAIGDCHGYYQKYLEIISGAEYSVQLGDHGFDFKHLDTVDASCHKIVGGNHENYDKIVNYPHYLGDFGPFELGGISMFFIRGAYSVDKAYRWPGVSWWHQEELTVVQAAECLQLYQDVRPRIVLSHDCPQECILMGCCTNKWKLEPSFTSRFLDECFKIHQPELWVFAHHHLNWTKTLNGTRFVCLDELQWLDISAEDGKINFIDSSAKWLLKELRGNDG